MTHSAAIIVWRRLTDGAEFAGAFVRDVREHRSIVVRSLADSHDVVVHRSNIVRGEGTCVECGRIIDTRYADRAFQECCFSCSHWREILAADAADSRPFAVIGGCHYTFDDDPEKVGIGYGGQQYVVLFTDGRSAATRDLWCQGVVPDHFRSRVPDNATKVVEVPRRRHSHA